jgi:cytochrome c2
MKNIITLFLTVFFITQTTAYDWSEPDWSVNASIKPGTHRGNIYSLPEDQLEMAKKQGYIHALQWPVEITGLMIPYEPLRFFMEDKKSNPLRFLLEQVAKAQLGYYSMDGMYDWLGLNKYPEENETGVFQIPFPHDYRPDYRMGASILETPQGKGMTFSCATCHSGTFMGKSVMGLTNKRSRANEFFWLAKKYIPFVGEKMFQNSTKATDDERAIFKRTKDRLKYINTRKPQVLGLDTSSAHVALSLSRRAKDDVATLDPKAAKRPRPHRLEHFVADSKPMPWWNLKYKTKWLSDGSIISGNPILMNILWNEIGRGTDLVELEKWMKNNETKVKELTTAVFANEPPHWLDFFPESSIDIVAAKRGETVFNNTCMKCHGVYQKGWSAVNADELSFAEKVKTTKVLYHKKTPIKNVGTDPNRYLGTDELAESLNSFKISKYMGLNMELQKGYVPSPLVGIFLRYPYMHNNSIPNLCALMEHPSKRPTRWVQGPSEVAEDYDDNCLGYPTGDKIPRRWWREKDAIFDARKEGLRNTGHDEMFWNKDGSAKISEAQKADLREYLKTL